ncbi:MAG TPA: hypothetical protein DCM57_01920 [Treponema sp.]|nr:hypothetical protein [Treponema sp.]
MDSSPECSLYVHIPFCASKCDYCDFFSLAKGSSVAPGYVRALVNEARWYASACSVERWKTIYIGGGTPSLLEPESIESLIQGLVEASGSRFPPGEITLEVNPQSLTEGKLTAAKNSGVTRLSMGIQSLCDNALKSVHRNCSSKKALEALELVNSKWNGSLNLDVMAGLPGQSRDEYLNSVEKILSWNADHISLYTLTIEDGTPLARRIEHGEFWDEDEADAQWMLGRDLVEKAGFKQYEVSNFAKKGFESRHNLAYWRQENYIGIGAGATGTVYSFDGEPHALRWTDTTDISRYTDFWLSTDTASERDMTRDEKDLPRDVENLDAETLEFEFLMMALRTLEGVSEDEYRRRYTRAGWNGNLSERLGENGLWKKYTDKGMTTPVKDGRYALNKKGILFLNSFLRELI